MVHEVDTWVGKLVDRLKESCLYQNTLIILSSDHGEMLGAHGLKGKGLLLEEATRVPLIVSFPGKISPGTVVKEPVSQIDLVSTILDYTGAAEYDKSDGNSLRRYMEKTSWNRLYQEDVAVVEIDNRVPTPNGKLSKRLGSIPNFMVRHGHYKLITTKKKESKVIDMMYDLSVDRYETENLIGMNGMTAGDDVIGKAEHLKILLIEWMRRMNGQKQYYSDPKWNLGEGLGDIEEVRRRRTWRTVDYWQSDTVLTFGKPGRTDSGRFVRNEFLYVGRTTKGKLDILSISIEGPHKRFFTVTPYRATIKKNGYIRIKVRFLANKRESVEGLVASVVIRNNVNQVSRVPIIGEPV